MRFISSSLLVMLLIPVFGGCRSPMTTEYLLLRVDPAPAPAEATLPLAVDVADVRAPLRYQNQVVYRQDRYRVGFYEHSRWAALPSDMVRRALIDALERSGLFSRVELIGQNLQVDLSLLAEIESFDQVIDGQEVWADFSLIVEAVRPDTRETVWSGRAAARIPQPGESRLAEAMSEAVGRSLAELIAEMGRAEAIRSVSGKSGPE